MRDCGHGEGGNIVGDDDGVASSERPSVRENESQWMFDREVERSASYDWTAEGK